MDKEDSKVTKDYKAEYELLMVNCIDNHPFFSSMLSNFRIQTRTDTPYAAGVWTKDQIIHMYINPEMFFEYPSEVQIGIAQHEIWHVILNHQERKYNRDHELFNVACDLAINKNLVPDKFLPPQGCFYDKAPFNLPKGLVAEEYYKKILEDENLKQKIGSFLGKGTVIVIDDHGVWRVEGDDSGIDPELVKEMVKKAVEKCGGIGNVPGNIQTIVSDIIQPAKIDWRSVLQMFVNKNVRGKREQTWSRFSKRLPGLVKGRKKAMIPKLGILIDASGSISDDQLEAFHSEVYHIHKRGVPVRIVVFDHIVHDEYEYEGKFHEVKGRGGTDFRPPFEAIEKIRDISAVVCLTDGEGPFPEKTRFQTLWVITQDGNINVPFGKVIPINV